jgi:NTP pyrophosphatase (non-canonical NTP hydrolase)
LKPLAPSFRNRQFCKARQDSGQKNSRTIKEELADIFLFLNYLSEVFKIDLLAEVEKKIAVNEARYPIEKARGSSKKYREF